ncbi:MAG: hypothetical protein R3E42_11975 [Burkholderiaceae bacterium]
MLARAGHRVTLIGRPQQTRRPSSPGSRMETQRRTNRCCVGQPSRRPAPPAPICCLRRKLDLTPAAAGAEIHPHRDPALVLCSVPTTTRCPVQQVVRVTRVAAGRWQAAGRDGCSEATAPSLVG